MKIKKSTRMLALMLAAALPAILIDCSKKDDPKAKQQKFEYFGTAAPGDAWSISGDPNNFTFTMVWDHGTSLDASDDVNVTGNYSVLPNGAYKLVITGCTPAVSNIPTNGSAILYGIEVPQTAMILNPAGSIEQYPMISMCLRKAGERANQNGDATWNYIRTAFPKLGFEHIHTGSCWGIVSSRVDAAAGLGYNMGETRFSLDCAEHDINSSVTCTNTEVQAGDPSHAIMSISDDGALDQIYGIDTKKFTGQITGSIFLADNGEGGGGQLAVKVNPSLAITDFNDNSAVYSGLTSSYDRSSSPAVITEHFLKLQFVTADSALIKEVTNFETDAAGVNAIASIRIKTIDNGFLKGYLYVFDGSLKMPFVGVGYRNGTKRLISFVSGRKTPSNASEADQIVAHFVTR